MTGMPHFTSTNDDGVAVAEPSVRTPRHQDDSAAARSVPGWFTPTVIATGAMILS